MLNALLIHLILLFGLHPFHVSVCEIDHNEDAQTLQVTHRIFIDDFEEALRNIHQNDYFDIVNPKNEILRDQMIKEYVQSRFSIRLDDQEIVGDYLGHEFDYDVVYCYVEYTDCSEIKTIEVTNTILIDQFEDQSNLIHITYNDEVKSLKLEKHRSTQSAKFN